MNCWPSLPMTLRVSGALLTIAMLAASAQAAQTTVYGEVIDVEALAKGPEVQCLHLPKPATSAGLAALLNWDLRDRHQADAECRQRQLERIQGYRVTYRYDGREFVDILQSDPGSRIALILELE